MSRRCSVCTHPDLAAIDRAIAVDKVPFRKIAQTYGITVSAVQRHKEAHTGIVPQGANFRAEVHSRVAAVLAGADLVAEVRRLRTRAESLGQQAEAAKDIKSALLAIRELTRLVELQGRLTIESAAGKASDVSAHPVWRLLAADIMRALAPYPEALQAVQRAMLARLGVDVPSDAQPSEPPALPSDTPD